MIQSISGDIHLMTVSLSFTIVSGLFTVLITVRDLNLLF
jgi:hypothetical protein